MKVQVTMVIDIPPTRGHEELDRIINEMELTHPSQDNPIETEVIEYELLG